MSLFGICRKEQACVCGLCRDITEAMRQEKMRQARMTNQTVIQLYGTKLQYEVPL